MKHLRLDLDLALDRIGDETILFGFFQDARHARQVIGRGDHHMRLDDDLGDLIGAALGFFQFALGACGKTHDGDFGKLGDGEKR